MSKDDDRSLGFLISDAARLMRTVFDRRVRRLELTRAQWLVLARLHRRPGASQSELADMMEVEKASAGRMIDRLERKGWIERRADPVDRRINRLYLTAEAENISQRMQAVAAQTVGDALRDLSPEQTELLADLMVTVKARLAAMAAMPEPLASSPKGMRSKTRRGSVRAQRYQAPNGRDSISRELKSRDKADAAATHVDRAGIAEGNTP